MSPVRKIIEVMKHNQSKYDTYSLESYNTEYSKFQKDYAQAKDFVKFLSTLERQFKNLRQDMNTIEETLPSLLTGLKLIWTISRHINTNPTKMESIIEAISSEICDKVKSQIDITKIFKMKPDESIALIQKGKSVLMKWKNEFYATKRVIEDESPNNRWDFMTAKDIFNIPQYMNKVLSDLEETCKIIHEFFAILGPDLTAVSGSKELIDEKIDKVV
jgi:dynein heavy chain